MKTLPPYGCVLKFTPISYFDFLISPHTIPESNREIQYIGNPTWPKYQGGGYNCMFNLAMDTTEPGFQINTIGEYSPCNALIVDCPEQK